MEKEQNKKKKGKKAPMSKKKLILLAVEILVLVAAVCILIIVMNFEDKNTRVNIDEEVLDIHVEVAENESMKGFRNIALFGVDSTTGSLGKDKQSKTRSDTIIIASINEVVKIHEEGSKRRSEAQVELAKLEDELKQALLEAGNR